MNRDHKVRFAQSMPETIEGWQHSNEEARTNVALDVLARDEDIRPRSSYSPCAFGECDEPRAGRSLYCERHGLPEKPTYDPDGPMARALMDPTTRVISELGDECPEAMREQLRRMTLSSECRDIDPRQVVLRDYDGDRGMTAEERAEFPTRQDYERPKPRFTRAQAFVRWAALIALALIGAGPYVRPLMKWMGW